eukprot:2100094-Alexandrium_andersonii.AAC.1
MGSNIRGPLESRRSICVPATNIDAGHRQCLAGLDVQSAPAPSSTGDLSSDPWPPERPSRTVAAAR